MVVVGKYGTIQRQLYMSTRGARKGHAGCTHGAHAPLVGTPAVAVAVAVECMVRTYSYMQCIYVPTTKPQ